MHSFERKITEKMTEIRLEKEKLRRYRDRLKVEIDDMVRSLKKERENWTKKKRRKIAK